jgi:nitrite reductase (NADH) large subunit
MRIIVVGNGLAGTIAAKTLRELESTVEVHVYGQEPYPYYPRPNLIEYLAGRLPYERLFAFPADWHVRQKIEIHPSSPLIQVLPETREVELADGRREKYELLLLASGGSAFRPPLRGVQKEGVFTLRTIDDAMAILGRLQTHPQAAVIGGGLLGLEIARALRSRGAEVQVVEFLDRLLPRQLDAQAAATLQVQIENAGIRVHLSAKTEEILGGDEVTGIRLENGERLSAGLVIIAAGMQPSLELARTAGLAVERGILVDDFLRTSHPRIFAVGDAIQHRGKVYGIIPAAFDQARAAAYNLLGYEKKYEGTVPSNTLKVAGLYVTSAGLVHPEGGEFQEIRKMIPEKGVYKKIVLHEQALVGAIWMGSRQGASEIVRAVAAKSKVGGLADSLLEDSFDFSALSLP